MPGTGFEAELTQLRRVADEALPTIGDIMRDQLAVLNSHEGLGGPGDRLPEVAAFQFAYAGLTDDIAARQKRGCDVLYSTAEVVREIVTLYMRADGQT